MTRFIALLCVIFTLWSFSARPTKADPITAALVAIGMSAATAAAVTSAIISLAITAAASMLSKALQKKPVPPGIKLERTATGGAVGRRGIIGFYATAGSEVCPPMSHGQDGKTPNAYLTKVIALSDIPTHALSAVMINGEFVPLTGGISEYGQALGGKYAGLGWVKFYDGRQTSADSMLVSRYAGYLRPWGADRIGKGVSYAIFTFKFNSDVFKGEPECKVELIGARLYDLRKDSSVGGSGTQRWDDPTTWGATVNPIVMVYNILRGIDIGGGHRYGGEATADDLPVSNWVAAMNVCDETVSIVEGVDFGTEPRYRAGYEIDFLEDEPASVVEELLKACSGSIVELGGVYKVRAGPPALPVMFVTDEDFIITSDQDYNPFPDIGASHNSINCVFPHPLEAWNTHEAPPYRVDAYVEQDDGIDLPASLQMPSCPFPWQVQRNMRAWLQDDRRWRQHSARFGQYAWALEPLDVVSWTSARNGYVDKLFEIDAADENLMTLGKRAQLREIDPADYDWVPDFQLPDPVTPGEWELPAVQAVPGWTVQPWSIKDGDGDDRRPALRLLWDGEAADDADLLKVQVRIVGTTQLVADFTSSDVVSGFTIVSEGILPVTSYEARAQFIVDRPTQWSSWLDATTGDIRLGDKDIGDIPVSFPDGTAPIFTYATVADLPTTLDPGPPPREVAYVAETGKLYRWDYSATPPGWTAAVNGGDLDAGTVDRFAFVGGLQPVGLGSSLPSLPDSDWPAGSMFVLTTDGKTYTNRGGTWQTGVDASDIDGTLTSDQIASLAAAKLTGSITSTQITDGAVSTPKLAAGSVITEKLAAGSVVADKIAARAVTVNKLLVTNFSLNPDPGYLDDDFWNWSGDFTSWYPSEPNGNFPTRSYVVWSNFFTGTGDRHRASDRMPLGSIKPGARIVTRVPIQNDCNRAVVAGIEFFDAAGNQIGSVLGDSQPNSGYAERVTNPTVVPSQAVTYGFVLYVGSGPAFSGAVTVGAITTTEAVTAQLIVDGSITTDKLVAGAVTTGKLAAGAVVADAIAADAIQARHLAIGNFDNIVSDGNYEDLSFWNGGGGGVSAFDRVGSGLDANWSNPRFFGVAAGSRDFFSKFFSVEPGAKYKVTFRLWSGNLTSGFIQPLLHLPGYQWCSLKMSAAAGINTGTPSVGSGDPAQGAYNTAQDTGDLSFVLEIPSLPTPVREIQFRLIGAFGGGEIIFQSKIVRISDQTLIGDSGIITSKLAAGAVTADKIVAGAVTAAKINVTNLAAINADLGDITAGNINMIYGSRRIRIKPGFGTSGDLLFWSGPTSVPNNSETIDNGVIAISATDGFFGGKTPSGPFDSTVQAAVISLPKNTWTTVAQVSNKYFYNQAYIVAALSYEIYVSGSPGGTDDYSYNLRLLMTNPDGSGAVEVPLSGLFQTGANNIWIDLRALNFREATVTTSRGLKNLYFQINPTGANIAVAQARNCRLKGAWTQPIT